MSIWTVPRPTHGNSRRRTVTGYLGGAEATKVRLGNPMLTHVRFPMYIAVRLWGGNLRDRRVRTLLKA